jgi:hypothetical protein
MCAGSSGSRRTGPVLVLVGDADPLQVELHHFGRSTLGAAGDLAGYGEQQIVRANVRLGLEPSPQAADDYWVQNPGVLPFALLL